MAQKTALSPLALPGKTQSFIAKTLDEAVVVLDSGEVFHDYETGNTLYFCRFNNVGQVYLSDGSGYAIWGESGNDADAYDVAMAEQDTGAYYSRHYVGRFDADGNITTAGTYRVVIYLQDGANPADTDDPIAHGEIYWDGTAEINPYTLDADVESLTNDILLVKNVYNVDESTATGVYPRNEL